MFQPERILVPMDFSEEALLALDWAVMLTGKVRGGEIFPAYVAPPIPDAIALDVGRAAYKEVTEDWVKARMADLQRTIPKGVAWNPVYAKGNPAEEIVEICRIKGIDLIVMTTHGRKGISHLLHTSVAESLVRTALCPVLVLHLNRTAVAAVHHP